MVSSKKEEKRVGDKREQKQKGATLEGFEDHSAIGVWLHGLEIDACKKRFVVVPCLVREAQFDWMNGYTGLGKKSRCQGQSTEVPNENKRKEEQDRDWKTNVFVEGVFFFFFV